MIARLLSTFAPSLLPGLGAFLNPWVLLAVLAAAVGLYAYGRHDGAKITEATWQAREAAEQAKAAQRISDLNREARAQERRHAEALAAISAGYQAKLQRNEDDKNRVIADLRARAVRLSIPARCPAPRGGAGDAAASAGGRDGAARAELSDEAAQFLVGEASRADAIVHQLTACQAVVRRDRGG
jgi:prophage endopeptidase